MPSPRPDVVTTDVADDLTKARGLVAGGVGVLTWQRVVRRRREFRACVGRAREMAALRHRGAQFE